MSAHLAHIRRHPIKSVGGEGLECVTLTPAQRLPGDREWAVLHGGATGHLDHGALTRWLPKAAFLRGAAAPALQAVKGGWQGDRIHLTHPDRPDLSFNPETDEAALLAWLAPLWGDDKSPPARLLRGPVGMTDSKAPLISILSLTSLRALEARLGRPIGMDRWRGNLWLDGLAPWAETGLIGRDIAIGTARLRVIEPIGRCPAVEVDTDTGACEGDVQATLSTLRGAPDFGIFAEVTQGGPIHIGDEVLT